MEIAFYFICIAFYILKNGLLRKLWLVSNFMTSQIGQQIIKMNILSNITRSKGNQAMKFSQLIYYEKREIYEITWEFFFFFFEKSFSKCFGEGIPRPIYKKSKLSVSLDQLSEMLQSLFLLYVHVKIYQNMLKLTRWPLVFTLYKAVLKNKKRPGASLPSSFSA